MNIRHIAEPMLNFGYGISECPRNGISNFNPYDIDIIRPSKVKLGIVGKEESIESVLLWLNNCKGEVEAKVSKRPKPNLFPAFPGFNADTAFQAEIVYDSSYVRPIKNSDFEDAANKALSLDAVITKVIELYIQEIRFLSKNKKPDVILCALPEKFVKDFLKSNEEEEEQEDEDSVEELEMDFRRMLKANSMEHNIPIQIVRDRIIKPTGEMQDPATIAWNLFTALYYKAGGTPWSLKRQEQTIDCYAGISFYRSRDKETLQTSIAQIFNELGKGVILRGEEVETTKEDKVPHLTDEQAYTLIKNSLTEYKSAIRTNPQRLVIHKTSNFNPQEIAGFVNAAQEHGVYGIDMVSIQTKTNLKLFREGMYPPRRGTHISFDEKNHLLYTRGSVEFYQTYPGKYPPNPLEVKISRYDSSPNKICDEILALTKMNWNNTQFDRKFPITVECARKVGDILKYVPQNEREQQQYSFYM
jgi:hypothetical protein